MLSMLRGEALRYAQIFLIVAPSFISFGYNQSGMGGVVDFPSWVRQFPQLDTIDTTGTQKSNNSTIQGTVVASLMLGACAGSLTCMWLGEILGRRKTIFSGACLGLIGQILECTSYSLPQLVVGRVLVGAGAGVLSATVPVWQSECSTAERRGRNVVLTGAFIALGYTLAQWSNFGLWHVEDEQASWRGSLAIGALFWMVIMASIFCLPESPYWLLRKNQSELAQQTLAALRAKDVSSPEVRLEMLMIESAIEQTAGKSLALSDVFRMGEDKFLYRFLLCIGLQFMQQMSGGTLISIYIPIIFQTDLGLPASTAKILAACAMTWKFIACALSFIIIDRLGRRAAFIISGGGMSACMIALTVSNSPSFAGEHAASIVSALFIFLYTTFLPVGFLGPIFLYPSEVAPAQLRVAMQAFAIANQWLWMFIVAMITPTALDTIGYRYYIVYAVIGGMIPPTIYFFYPETKNRSLEDIDRLFREAPSVLSVVSRSKMSITPTFMLDDMDKATTQEIE
ncbi:hypothetical protein UA08_08124 [Talaromyces atroroseus]|uniref:Major facilitator superfamily (MFS) profile domain-containing protein n=1 Tax=Talaromyces atroroseus TaxID=1441469 RepID=A0A225A7F4_TALAT|nr:hypothetical protein UA08_08124 [Talaromyces atroroseus]OKL56581.1 hypothetical protein UA08_08124 [Talaromyces atroroseus]